MDLLENIRYALAVRRAGSLSAAAENLFMAQPNLSRCLRNLEDELELTLFIRKSTGVIPTEDGEIFLSTAEPLVHQLDSLISSCKKSNDDSIRIFTSQISCFFAPSESIQRKYPDRDIQIQQTYLPEMLSAVQAKMVNVALVSIPDYAEGDFQKRLYQKELVFESVFSDYYYLVCKRSCASSFSAVPPAQKDLERLNLYCINDMHLANITAVPPLKCDVAYASPQQILRMVCYHPGSAAIAPLTEPTLHARYDLEAIPLSNYPIAVIYGYIRRADFKPGPFLSQILAEVLQGVEELAGKSGGKPVIIDK